MEEKIKVLRIIRTDGSEILAYRKDGLVSAILPEAPHEVVDTVEAESVAEVFQMVPQNGRKRAKNRRKQAIHRPVTQAGKPAKLLQEKKL